VEYHLTLQKPGTFSGDTCVEPEFVMKSMAWPATWTPLPTGGSASGTMPYASQSKTTFDPGLPFGKYALTCIADSATNKVYKPSTPPIYDNTSPNGGALLDINVSSSTYWKSGSC
jgi:hypothetical protein